jgi:hypothetical protein
MIRKRTFFATVAAVALAVLAPAASSLAADPDYEFPNWITVNQVLVNRLGGVSVSGEVSCAGAYDDLVQGRLTDDSGNVIVLAPGDRVNLLANNDNYLVSQPSRGKVIQLYHGSSVMTPCYVTADKESPDHTPWPSWTKCRDDGTACTWETMKQSYERQLLGPLFDYTSDGKFKSGLLNVSVDSFGLLIMVEHSDGSWGEPIFIENGSYATTSQNIRAVGYR